MVITGLTVVVESFAPPSPLRQHHQQTYPSSLALNLMSNNNSSSSRSGRGHHITDKKKEGALYFGQIDDEDETKSSSSLLEKLPISTLLILGVLLVVDNTKNAALAESLQGVLESASSQVLVLSDSTSNNPFVNVVAGAFRSTADSIVAFLTLMYQVILVLLPIMGKALQAACGAALPPLKEGFVAFFESLQRASQASGEAVLPFVDQAKEAMNPYLEQATTTSSAAGHHHAAVTTTTVVKTSSSEQIKEAFNSAIQNGVGPGAAKSTPIIVEPSPTTNDALSTAASSTVKAETATSP